MDKISGTIGVRSGDPLDDIFAQITLITTCAGVVLLGHSLFKNELNPLSPLAFSHLFGGSIAALGIMLIVLGVVKTYAKINKNAGFVTGFIYVVLVLGMFIAGLSQQEVVFNLS